MMLALLTTLAQTQISFSDLQKGMRDQLSGNNNDASHTYIWWAIVAGVVLLAILLQVRQRKKSGEAPSSPSALYREISRGVPFPFGTRLLLQWVARSVRVPAATLLISDRAFQQSVEQWSQQPTFALIRQWGTPRLHHLHEMLFENM
jgi:hypothetical protein